jgi:hypothetical protein
MKLDEFKRHTETRGADFSHWPVELVKPALALIESSPEAKTVFNAALRLDAQMRLYAPPSVTPDRLAKLEERIMKSVAQGARALTDVGFMRFFPVGKASAGLFAAALLGFIIGVQPAAPVDSILNSVVYAPDQIISGADVNLNDEGDF